MSEVLGSRIGEVDFVDILNVESSWHASSFPKQDYQYDSPGVTCNLLDSVQDTVHYLVGLQRSSSLFERVDKTLVVSIQWFH